VLLVVFSCKKEATTPIVIENTTKTDSIIYSSANIKPHLKFNFEYIEYELIKLKTHNLFTTGT
jgi:hypothetical protein